MSAGVILAAYVLRAIVSPTPQTGKAEALVGVTATAALGPASRICAPAASLLHPSSFLMARGRAWSAVPSKAGKSNTRPSRLYLDGRVGSRMFNFVHHAGGLSSLGQSGDSSI